MTRVFPIEKINFDIESKTGSALLESNKTVYVLVWLIKSFPVLSPGLPGAPYPVEFIFTLYKKNDKRRTQKSMSGQFVFEINSGTLPNYSPLGIPFGEYKTVARNNNRDQIVSLVFSLNENDLQLELDDLRC
jgi:hypothetical protein